MSSYNLEKNVLLFYPTSHDTNKRVNVQFDEVDFKEMLVDENFGFLLYFDGTLRFNILKIEKNKKSGSPLPYELGFDGNEIFGYAYDSTGFQLYSYRIEKDLLKKAWENKFKLKTNFETTWMTMKFARQYLLLKVEKFRNWIILYMLDNIERKYIISKFNINSNTPVLKEIYSGADMGGRFHNTNLFVYEDLQSKRLKIIEDIELQ